MTAKDKDGDGFSLAELLDNLGQRIAAVGFLFIILGCASVLFASAYWIVDQAGLETWREMTKEKPPAISDQGLVEVRPTSPSPPT